jgi:hypothetical protein
LFGEDRVALVSREINPTRQQAMPTVVQIRWCEHREHGSSEAMVRRHHTLSQGVTCRGDRAHCTIPEEKR